MRAGRRSTACHSRNGKRRTRTRLPRRSSPPSQSAGKSTDTPHLLCTSVDDSPSALTRGARISNLRAPTQESSMATAAATIEEPATRFAKDHLKAFVERIERLEEEKKAMADDIRDVCAEAKGTGFDGKALRPIVRLRKQDIDERKEQEAILETYMHALGMLA